MLRLMRMRYESYVADAPCRLDVFLTERSEFSRSHVKTLIEEGAVTVQGEPCKKAGFSLKSGQTVTLAVPDLAITEALPEDIPLDIVYQDDSLAVINKQQGLTVHPANNCYSGTLVNALLFSLNQLSGINGTLRPGIVHRLDKNTSGLLVVAKNDIAHRSLAEQIALKTCRRTYVALVYGVVKEDSGVIITNIGRSLKDRKKMAVVADGKQAITEFTVLERVNGYSLVRFDLKTGRTHQIRVHCKHMHHPIVGDTVYGPEKDPFHLEGQLLHAFRLAFNHPVTGEWKTFSAPLPPYFISVMKKLGFTKKEEEL